ncbi:hypothetical protein SAMN04488009_3711 [Maribacter sedimenticola]|uniref:Uncharacterized protein n=1 Tax=Maribacter sedimenticola TaxID=228956 RepID=A0ABY1SM31_9FLAO|nr:hypothetical protein SAMN04488009_3711 [Maribacter sedimenticola]
MGKMLTKKVSLKETFLVRLINYHPLLSGVISKVLNSTGP